MGKHAFKVCSEIFQHDAWKGNGVLPYSDMQT